MDSLPTELQCSFIRLLDPIGLISLSQTSKHFRLVINPAKEHFIERLLQLETLEEYGGPTPSVEPWDVDIVLNYCQSDRKDIRWACTSCVRLLPRRCFRNRSILDLDYQKPMREDPLLDEPTSWEPLARTVPEPEVEGGTVREDWIFLQVEPSEENPLLNPDIREPGTKPRATSRQNRRCLECQYHRGELRPLTNGLGGNAKVPIQPNRVALFYTELDRYFPRIFEYLGCEIPPAVENKLLGCNRIDPFACEMRMVRCPECTSWKELRDFRLQVRHLRGTRYREEEEGRYNEDEYGYRENMEALLKDACCNACFAKANGRLELGRALSSWFRELVDRRLQEMSSELRVLAREFPWDIMMYSRCMELRQGMGELEDKVPCFDLWHNSILNEEDILQLRVYRANAIRLWETLDLDKYWYQFNLQRPKLISWSEDHEFCEKVLRDLKFCKEMSRENSEAFAAWALDRDEKTWDHEVEGALTRGLGPDMFYRGTRYNMDTST